MEDLVEGIAIPVHHRVELADPLDEYHPLVALLLLERISALDDSLLELLEADGSVSALVGLHFCQAIDLVLGQASLQALQTGDELRLG